MFYVVELHIHDEESKQIIMSKLIILQYVDCDDKGNLKSSNLNHYFVTYFVYVVTEQINSWEGRLIWPNF